jgi:hypothetical protein
VEQRRDRSRIQVTDFVKLWHVRRADVVAGQTDGGKSYFILFMTRLKTGSTLLPLSMESEIGRAVSVRVSQPQPAAMNYPASNTPQRSHVHRLYSAVCAPDDGCK